MPEDRDLPPESLSVLFIGERPRRDSPSATLADALRRRGFIVRFEADATTPWGWLRLTSQSHAMILVAYHRLGIRRIAKLGLGISLGRPLIRWWVGSDVMYCVENRIDRWFSRSLNRLVALNVAVAPHLREELASVAIDSVYVPMIFDHGNLGASDLTAPPARRILVYLPTSRDDFYGGPIVRRAVEANPDLEFIIVGGEDQGQFKDYANAHVLGRVRDIASVYPQVGCLLRITRHDGLPRMVLESLLQGKYVIYSYPTPGCWYARDLGQIQEQLTRFRECAAANLEGIEAARRMLQPDPTEKFVEMIREVVSRDRFWSAGQALR